MKPKIFMSPNNAQCVIGTPLFKYESNADAFGYNTDKDYALVLINAKPDAYILDLGKFRQLVAADWAHEYLIEVCEL